MSLYEIKTELMAIQELMDEWAEEHEGDITEFPFNDELDKLEMDLEAKALSVGVWYKTIVSEATAIGEEIKALSKRKTALSNRAGRLKDYLQTFIPAGEKFKNERCVIGWRKSTQVNVSDKLTPEDVMEFNKEFIRVKYEIDKTRLKKELAVAPEITIKDSDGHDRIISLAKKQNIQIK